MKKLLATLSLICLFAVSSTAQTEFHWGFKGGLNFTTFDSDADDFQARMGQWGAIARWKFNENIALQTELFYARMGVRSLRKTLQEYPGGAYYTKEDNNSQVFQIQLLTDNIQLPVLVKWYLPVNLFGGRGLNVHAGPLASYAFEYKLSTSSNTGFLLRPDIIDKDGGTTDHYSIREIARARNQFTLQAVYGVGYDSPSGIGVDIRYQMGITPVWDKDEIGCFNTHSHDRVWALCFSYTF